MMSVRFALVMMAAVVVHLEVEAFERSALGDFACDDHYVTFCVH